MNSSNEPTAHGQRVDGLRSGLGLSTVYDAVQRALGANRMARVFAHEYVRAAPGVRVLDIGCGTSAIHSDLGDVLYVGIEPNERYASTARDRVGTNGQILVGGIGSPSLDEAALNAISGAEFDIVIMVGVLHHLTDDMVLEALALAGRVAPGGRFVSIDPTLLDNQRKVARALARRDRGQHVRSPEHLDRLLQRVGVAADLVVRNDLLRVPYDHVITSLRIPET